MNWILGIFATAVFCLALGLVDLIDQREATNPCKVSQMDQHGNTICGEVRDGFLHR